MIGFNLASGQAASLKKMRFVKKLKAGALVWVLAPGLVSAADIVETDSFEKSNGQLSRIQTTEACRDESKCLDREQQGKVVDDSRMMTGLSEPNTEFELIEKHWVFHGLADLPSTIEEQTRTDYIDNEYNLSDLRFTSGYHYITPEVEATLGQALAELTELDIVSLHVVGHTDNQGLSQRALKRYRDNQELSEARAASIADWLSAKLKLSPEIVSTAGYGFTRPLADNNTPQGMSKNRRVELIVKALKPVEKQVVVEVPRERDITCDLPINRSVDSSSAEAFKLTLDGQAVSDLDEVSDADMQRCTDVALAETQIRLSYNDLEIEPKLNVAAAVVDTDDHWQLYFKPYSNYRHAITRQEVRLFTGGASPKSEPLLVAPLIDSQASVKLPKLTKNIETAFYRLRVYDSQGRFDETGSFPLNLPKRKLDDEENEDAQQRLERAWLSSYGNSHLAFQNIPLSGGTVRVYGEAVPEAHQAFFLGQLVPVNKEGKFVAEQILPSGIHRVEVAVLDEQEVGKVFRRNLSLKADDWFYVALADITLGRNSIDGPAELLSADQVDDELFLDGRLAFYLSGKWQDEYRITASADSREAPLEDLFSNFNDKDPQSLLRRLEEENHYTVYGDDSTITEDAPTQGKFYFKIEDDLSSLMWGNFKSDINDTDLARLNRGLYGASLDWNSAALTEYGERRTEIDLFASEPDTLAANEDFRGTGGSLYYLKHQDITSGSESIFVEVRDKDSGLVISSERLVPGEDYDIDMLQGRVLLTKPLSSVSSDSVLLRDQALGGNPQYLVVSYEYTSLDNALSDMLIGGRVSHWFGDQLQIGVTAKEQDGGTDDERLLGLDSTYRFTPSSYIKVEIAQTEGNGTELLRSLDGGYAFNTQTAVNLDEPSDDKAKAIRLESGFKAGELGFDKDIDGHFYVQTREAGYSGTGQLSNYDSDQVGAQITVPLSEESHFKLKADATDEDGNLRKHAAEINYTQTLEDGWQFSAGVRNEDLDYETSNTNDGQKTDAALQLDYESEEGWKLYAFAQGTIDRDEYLRGNNRGGLGGEYPFTEKLSLNAEVSDGNDGLGALLGSHYQFSDASHAYLNYELDPDGYDDGHRSKNGQVVLGSRYRYSDSTSVYGEERYQHGRTQGLTQAYGMEYTPVEQWIFGTNYEQGRIKSDGNEIDRRAVGFSVSYNNKPIKASSALEYREDEDSTGQRDSWLIRNNIAYQVSQDWRTQLRADWAVSDASADLLDAYYREFLLGFAYRPVDNDRLNALFSYNYLGDLSPAEQVNSEGTTNDFSQRSHVVSVDINYDIHPQWTIGAKHAHRYGKLKDGRDSGEWYTSRAKLYIARVDWHLVRRWDVLAEARLLTVDPASDERKGMLLAVHRHFGDNFKAGLGYNFTDFSDDLTNLNYDAHGWFLNVIGKL